MDKEQAIKEFIAVSHGYLLQEVGYSHFSDHNGTTWGSLANVFKKCQNNMIDVSGDVLRDRLIAVIGSINEKQEIELEQIVTAWDQWRYIVNYLKNN